NLDNDQVLYSLIGVNKWLNTFVHDSVFTSHLTLMRRFFNDSIYPLSDTILDRFYFAILPSIHHKIQWLNVESLSMEHVLFCTDYPNLCKLGLCNHEIERAKHLFTNGNVLTDLFKNQILPLIIQLHVHVLHFNDCRYLLDGRVNQLGVFRVKSSWIRRSSRLTINNTESLPNMKCFSLYCDTDTLVYDELIVPHFYIEC
ncbi:unnamed protein product, partial [Rotaria sp. Silwood1]